MGFLLHVVRGRSSSESIKLMSGGVNTVGRHDDCQVRIKSSQVSRRHCELVDQGGTLILKDLGSANGTYVNGERVEGQRTLAPGDELNIGGIKLRVVQEGAAAAAPAARPGPAAGDTAVVDAIAASEVGGSDDDEFEIEFDDEPSAEVSVPEAKPSVAAPSAPAAETPPSRQADAPDSAQVADDAIADFLLDLKIDED